MRFEEFGLKDELLRGIKQMGFSQPTPIQEQAIPLGLKGVDVLGAAETGSGKTVAFVLPLLHQLMKDRRPGGVRALVLVPTRELAMQVCEAIRCCGRYSGLRAAPIIGGVNINTQRKAVAGGAQILVATPGRILDHLRQKHFRLAKVEQVVLDEADRMFDMGFLPDIRSILSHLPPRRQTYLFSATLHPEVKKIAAFALHQPQRVEVTSPSSIAEGITQVIYPVSQQQKADLLLSLLASAGMHRILVFTRTKHGADKVAKRLRKSKHKVGVLHANRSQNQRTSALAAFRKNETQMMVATDIAARGIDVENISHVVNYDVPRHPEDYIHRVVRTARAKGVGDAFTLMDKAEEKYVRGIEQLAGITIKRVLLSEFDYSKIPVLPTAPRPGTPRRPSGQPRGRRKFGAQAKKKESGQKFDGPPRKEKRKDHRAAKHPWQRQRSNKQGRSK